MAAEEKLDQSANCDYFDFRFLIFGNHSRFRYSVTDRNEQTAPVDVNITSVSSSVTAFCCFFRFINGLW